MRFLIVDPSRDLRGAVAGMLRARWPAAAIEEWDPHERGNPEAALKQASYAAVLMYVEPAASDALAWMAVMLRDPAAPPVILLTESGGENLALQGLGCKVEWREYAMPHAVCGEEIADIAAWLRAVL